ncbi:MAG: DUF3696 domain-containing protein [Caldisericia bacterium]
MEQIYFSGIRQFRKLNIFPVKEVNIVVGPNSSGKSTLSIILLLLFESFYALAEKYEEDRKKVFERREFYRLLQDSKDEAIIGFISGADYYEFVYYPEKNFVDIKSFEYGIILENNSRKKLFKWKTIIPNSQYLKNLKRSDFVSKLFIRLSKYIVENFDELYSKFWQFYQQRSHINGLNYLLSGYCDYVSEDLISEALKLFEDTLHYKFEVNRDLLTSLLFSSKEFFDKYSSEKSKQPKFDLKDLVVSEKKYQKIIKDLENLKRDIYKIDLFVDKYGGTDELKKFSIEEISNHLTLSFLLALILRKEVEKIIYDIPYNVEIIDETRTEPPEYITVEKDQVIGDYYELFSLLQKNDKYFKKYFISYLKLFNIADNISIKKIGFKEPFTNYYEILLTKGKQKFPLKNLSSGGKQILPILILFAKKFREQLFTYFFIRQPELHLHPRLQMKIPELIDFSHLAQMDGTAIFIETHSEHIVRKFQLLIAQNKSRSLNKFINVLYTEPDKTNSESVIKVLELDENGNFITDWPSGFFDEAAELALLLLEAQIKRKN